MRKESTVIFGLALLATVGIVGTLSYLHQVNNSDATERFSAPPASQVEPHAAEQGAIQQQAQTGSNQPPLRQQISGRTDTPIECTLPDGSTFWTNAATCEQADLNNRISIADPVEVPRLERAEQERQSRPRRVAQETSRRKPTLHRIYKEPPPGIPTECRFPVGRALEIERMLATADNPYESGWRKSYCRFRNEACEDQCPVADSFYYYRVHNICRGEFTTSCPYDG